MVMEHIVLAEGDRRFVVHQQFRRAWLLHL
jgi:hypothetical protein